MVSLLIARRLAGARTRTLSLARPSYASRTLFSWLKRDVKANQSEPKPILSQDDLFHHFSKSPLPAIRARGEAIQKLAPCPVCASSHEHIHAHTKAQPKTVQFECPDCGWPTHCSEEHWKEDTEHEKYCKRLREVNEDEHDLRSGRRMKEFEMPGIQDEEAAISFANWDLLWYTRGFPSMNTERSRRHASKVLTYPMTIGSVLHQHSPLTLSNQRLTPEGSRSLAALRSNLHVPMGSPETAVQAVDKPQMRIFVLGARAESSLPASVWEQLQLLFPSAVIHLFFIGLQTSLPKPDAPGFAGTEDKKPSTPNPNSTDSSAASSPPLGTPPSTIEPSPEVGGAEEKPVYLPNVYEPPSPLPIVPLKHTRSSIEHYGVPSYTTPYSHQLTITGMQANYSEVHALFQETFDPYTDCFFLFSPGFGFPSATSVSEETGEPLLQIASPTEWGPVIPALLATRCPIFVTGFSPADVERDVKSLSTAPEVAGQFEWVITPGPNPFGSEKWEVADFDPRVMVKTNWGVWGIRGKTREIREKWSTT